MERTHAQHGNGASGHDPSLTELARHLSDESSRLARLEVELAKTELAHKGRQVGMGARAFGAGGILGLFALGAFTTAAILGLATAVAAWLAALIVAAAIGVSAAIFGLVGKDRIESARPPAPEQAIASSKRDIQAAKLSAKEARQ